MTLAIITLYFLNIGLTNSVLLNSTAQINASLSASLNNSSLTQAQVSSITAQIINNNNSIQTQAVEAETSFRKLYFTSKYLDEFFWFSFLRKLQLQSLNFLHIDLILILYLFRWFKLILFSRLCNKRIAFDGAFVLSIIMSFWAMYTFIRYETSYSVGIDRNTGDGAILVMQRGLNDSFMKVTVSNAITMITQWILVVMALKASKTFGTMIETIITMIVSILKYSWILIVLFAWFSTIGRVWFFDITSFTNMSDSFIYLFNAIFAQIDFTIFQGDHVLSTSQGNIFLVAFIILFNIIMLNFLIAILASIYDSVDNKSNSLYLNQMIKINHSINQNKIYSSLSYSYVPFNLIVTIILPIILKLKSKKLNSILLLLTYFPVMLVGVVLFFLCSNILVPLSYLIILKAKLLNLFDTDDEELISIRIRRLAKFFWFGVFHLIALNISDTAFFCISLFDQNLKLRNPKAEDDEIFSNIDAGFLEVRFLCFFLPLKNIFIKFKFSCI